jgi:hypothetical protein
MQSFCRRLPWWLWVAPAGPFLVCLALAAEITPRTVKVQPQETEALFANPGMGWQTFHRFADEDRNLAGLPSGSAYFRFYWREIEPQDGQIDFARFDELLAHARRAGQKLAFRIMCTGSGQYMDVPSWLRDQGCKGIEFTYGGRRHWVPDFADPLFQQAHLRLIRELGARYDGHPDMDLLDIGSVGLWGEWHMSGTEAVETGKPVPLPSLEIRHALIDAWRSAFPKTSKVILIGSEEGMARATRDGYGWRADCLGDMGGFSKTWNHMDNFYLQQLEKTRAQEAWKRAPVAFESCWDMRKWKQEGWDIAYVFDYALRCHASYMNNKSAPIPDGARPEVERFLRKLGYRLVLRSIEHAREVAAGSDLPVRMNWENVGVAPPYRDYRVAFRLSGKRPGPTESVLCANGPTIQGWLPGPHSVELAGSVPSSLPPGRYTLDVGVLHPVERTPEVRLAITARNAEGWYSVSEVDVTR